MILYGRQLSRETRSEPSIVLRAEPGVILSWDWSQGALLRLVEANFLGESVRPFSPTETKAWEDLREGQHGNSQSRVCRTKGREHGKDNE